MGAETAAWRYYGRPLSEMSLAEYATLAVLPNAPALIHPNRNRSQLKEKRNMLLAKLVEKGSLSLDELELFQEEDIPNRLRALPQNAMHLLNAFIKEFPNQNRFISYIDRPIQQKPEHYSTL